MTGRKLNKPLLVLILGTVILCVSFGVRSSLGVYMKPISLDLGWGVTFLTPPVATTLYSGVGLS